ncbi:MAG: peptidase dimerization domain protein, partial [Bacteroidia bacterium]
MEHSQIKEYIQANKQRFLDELMELLRIPSISAKPEHAPDMQRMAEAVKEKFIAAGADKVEVC